MEGGGEKGGEGERMDKREKRKKGGEGRGREEEERKEGGERTEGMMSGDLGNEWSPKLGQVGIEDFPVEPGYIEFHLGTHDDEMCSVKESGFNVM